MLSHCSLRARLRPGRAHAPEGGPLSEPEAGPAAAAGLDFMEHFIKVLPFRIIPGSAP